MTTIQDIAADWAVELQPVVCENCDWYFLAQPGSTGQVCPHCFSSTLQTFDTDLENLPAVAPPEMLIPFRVPAARISSIFAVFQRAIPFPGPDTNPQKLAARMRTIYLPMWLVDAAVSADWKAQAGFQYQVESHKSTFRSGQWSTRKVYETRLDWENRIGKLERTYKNVTAPALEEHQKLMRYLGEYAAADSQPYDPDSLADAIVRLPNRASDDAFTDAQENFRKRASSDVQQAVEANDIRNFNWRAAYSDLNWTLLLLPVFASYYEDDAGVKRKVFINGYTGFASGEQRGSMKRAQRITAAGLAVSAAIIVVAIILALLTVQEEIAVLAAITGAVVGIVALYPVIAVWRFNENAEKTPHARVN